MEKNYGILLILLLPVLGGIIGFYLGKKNKTTRNDWIDLIMIAELAMQGYLVYQLVWNHTTMKLSLSDFLGLGFSFTVDGVRLMFCIISTVVFGIVCQFMKESMQNEAGSNRFYLLYMCMYSMVLGAYMTTSLFNFFIFLTFAALFAYPMIMHRQDKLALKNAGIYMGFLIAAVAIIQVGLVLVYVHLGHVGYLGMYYTITLNGNEKAAVVGGLLISIGFAIFSGMFPLQFKVTRGCSYGLMEGSVLLTSMVSKLGVFGMMLLASNLLMKISFFGRILMLVSLLTIIWGLLISLTSTDIRKILMGINIATNGFNALAVSFMVLCGDSNGYAIRSSLYILVSSMVSFVALYMAALEQVRKMKTYEIKGLIESGKENKLLAVVCFLACASLAGVPGTAGFLGYSLLFETILMNLGWKWLLVLYIILWAFLMTSITRVFMKLFVSKKEEALRILTTEEEANQAAEPVEEKDKSNPYLLGEFMLLLVSLAQLVIGILPNLTVDKMANPIAEFFKGENIKEMIPYYAGNVWIGCGIAALLCVLLYVNLVHGVLLRAIRNKKNRKLQENMSEQE